MRKETRRLKVRASGWAPDRLSYNREQVGESYLYIIMYVALH